MATTRLPSSVILVGAGKMGGALLEGWLAVGLCPDAIAILDPAPSERIQSLCRARGLTLNPAAPPAPEVLVLAVKPQSLDEVAAALEPLAGPDTLVLSIMAGKSFADLHARLPRARALVRAMPNLPASIGRGATGAVESAGVTPAQREAAHGLLSAVGVVEWVESEALIDAVTALSGSGPAYVFHLAECLARAGAAAGLPAELAARLARATVAGAGALLAESPLPAEALRENVTSPGGTTAAALEVLMSGGRMEALLTEAVAAAKRRAQELAG